MAKTMDGFSQHQTRLTVVIDGLDSCEQDKVLQMLDTVRVLFSKGPFISIFASDPHIIIKAINQNLNSVLRDSNINGHDYMRNIVHLPVFLNSRGLSSARKMCSAPSASNGEANASEGWHEELDRKLSQHSLGELTKFGSKTTLNRRDTYRRRQVQRSVTRQMSFDLTKLMVTEDWFNDISPQTMRRLLNIVSVTGRLLRANQITFNWDRLASWINLTEQWPYRTSWIILYLEESDGVPEQAALKTIYERVSRNIPTTKDVEPLLEIDGDVRSFEVFLSSRTPVLTARDIRTFLPCTVNLDPKLREIIADVRAAREQVNMGGVPYPAPPLQEAAPRPSSMYSQVSSPGGGGGPPLPHSSFYSGLAGPQHPFYNRPYFPHHLYQQQRPLMVPHLHLQPPHLQPPHLHLQPPHLQPPHKPGRHTCAAPSKGSSLNRKQGSIPPVLLSSMTTEGVCERVHLIEGIDQSMMGNYSATIRKANVNGRVLTQCNIDELKKEMNMNFGDWQLFRASVLEMRSMESQLLHEEAASEQGSTQAPPPDASIFSFNLSFEDLSSDEPPRAGNTPWTAALRTASLTSLNSQESSSLDVSRLTDRQQDEYRSAYEEYVSQMAQTELSGAERPVQPQPVQFLSSSESREDTEGRRATFGKRTGAGKHTTTTTDNNNPDLDPIREEDEKNSEHTAGARGRSYKKIEEDEELKKITAMKGKDFLSDATLDKKDSSDSGVRSNESSPNHSLQDEEAELEEDRKRGGVPGGVPGVLQDVRMSICSEDCSLMASSPEDSWSFNLNSVSLNNNSNSRPRPLTTTDPAPPSSSSTDVILSPSSAPRPAPTNENVRVVHLRRGLRPGDPPEVCSVSSDTVTFGDERESIL
ncbi:hypothetical protein NQZ68_021912 [Dissostichus eleginoides]|nr:hypothetical protein NQZ68_021912 [Dissostichus eleginoides]